MASKINKNAQKWVEALKSGEYSQTTDYLCNDGGFCCLGVACEVFLKETGLPLKKYPNPSDIGFDENLYSVPEVKEWLGLAGGEGRFVNEFKGRLTLTTLNDDEGLSFKEIAEFIETNPEGLFVDDSED